VPLRQDKPTLRSRQWATIGGRVAHRPLGSDQGSAEAASVMLGFRLA
jgi:hypothetical protein